MSLKKLLLSLTLIGIFGTISASASTIEFTIGKTEFAQEKNTVISQGTIEAAPFISNDRTMVPIRAISDVFDAQIEWNGNTQEVTVLNNNKKVVLKINSTTAYIDDTEITLDVAPQIISDRTFVPLRFISEALEYNVNYVNATKQVVIDDTPVVVQCGEKKMSFAEYSALYHFYENAYIHLEADGTHVPDEVKEYLSQTTVEKLKTITKFSDTFSYMTPTAGDTENILLNFEEVKDNFSASLPGLSALVCEKYYLWSEDVVLNKIALSEDVQGIYENNYICAKHILVEDEAQAEAVYKKAVSGSDFDKLVAEYGTDPGMIHTPEGYVFTKGQMVKEFEEASFALEVGKISKPVKSQYGYHIIMRIELPELDEQIKGNICVDIGNKKLSETPEPEVLISVEELNKKEIFEL